MRTFSLLLLLTMLLTISCKKQYVLDTYHTFHDEEISMAGATLSKVYFYNETIGFLSDATAGLHKTVNGGASWTKINSTMSDIGSIYFLNATTGFITANGTVYKTVDGGVTFTSVYSGGGAVLDIAFADAKVGYGCGNNGGNGRVIKTTDGGDTWFVTVEDMWFNGPFTPNKVGRLFKIQVIDASTVYCMEKTKVIKTINGADVWTRAIDNFGVTQIDMAMINNNLYICGNDGELTDFDEHKYSFYDLANSPSGNRHVAAGENVIYSYEEDLGNVQWVYYLDSGGISFTKTFISVAFADENTIFAIDDKGTLTKLSY